MKTDRFSSASIRIAAILLAGLLLAAGLPATDLQLGGIKISIETSAKRLAKAAKALAQETGEVQKSFDTNRRALRITPGPGGKPAYPLQDVAGLITRTGEDLDQAIEKVGEPGLEGLRAWSDEELRRIKEGLAAPSGRTAALFPGLSTPRVIAVVASLKWLPLQEIVGAKAAAPRQETINAEKADGLLDQVGAVVSRIFFLASHDDLEVKLWVGSTPAPQATFRFWPQGKVKGTPAAPLIIRTNGKRDHVLRGLYSYRAAWAKGPVTELVEYPNLASAPADQSERLDLVNGSSFFCCRFNEQYCHHVADEKECRP